MKECTMITENLKNNCDVCPPNKNEKILLHACCGPCSLEPFKILNDAGWSITIMYSNNNIYPEHEYTKRFKELEKWANKQNIKLIKDNYDADSWKDEVIKYGEYEPNSKERKLRCGACYKHRLKNAAKFAINNNIKYLASTLAVSPYQYLDVLNEKLIEVCNETNLKPVLFDFRPYYSDATKLSKELGMYRQKYCGCKFSLNESMEQFKRSKNKKYLKELESIISS